MASKTCSILVQFMACCLMAPSHYLNQFWPINSEVSWYSPQGNFQEMLETSIHETSLKMTNLRLIYNHISLGLVSYFLRKLSRSKVNARVPLWCLLCLNKLLGPRWPAPSPCNQCVQEMYMVATRLWHRQSYARLAGNIDLLKLPLGALGSKAGECVKGYCPSMGRWRSKESVRHPPLWMRICDGRNIFKIIIIEGVWNKMFKSLVNIVPVRQLKKMCINNKLIIDANETNVRLLILLTNLYLTYSCLKWLFNLSIWDI